MDLRARLLVKYKKNIIDDLANETIPAQEDLDELVEIEKKESEKEAELEKDQAVEEVPVAYLTEHENKFRMEVMIKVMEAIDLSKIGNLEDDEARSQIQEISKSIIDELNIPLAKDSRHKLVQVIEDEILGLGPLEMLMRDLTVSEIMVNGAKNVFIEKSGQLQPSPVVFDDDDHVMKIVDRIVTFVGRRIDESSPMADARLADGSRVNIIIPPLALDGPTITIRRFPADPLTLEGLVGFNALSPGMAELLKSIVKIGKNVLISGGTGSGKTTALNALSAFIPHSERIVTIEDAAELQLQQAHVVRLETRPANIEGNGEIGQRDLVKNALRMRPDRIVIGEVRGAEAMDMLQAMNTGHDGSLTTTHANTPRDALSRIENMVAMAGFELPMKAVRAQIASAIHYVIQVTRLEDGSRRMTNISEVNGMEGDVITMTEIFTFDRRGLDENFKILGAYKPSGAIPSCVEELGHKGVVLDNRYFDPDNEVEG